MLAQRPTNQHLSGHRTICHTLHAKLQQTIIEQYQVIRLDIIGEALIGRVYAIGVTQFVSANPYPQSLPCFEQHRPPITHSPGADFGPLQVCNYGDILTGLIGNLPQQSHHLLMRRMITMREVDACHVHARPYHPAQHIHVRCSWPHSAYYFGRIFFDFHAYLR